MKRFYFLFVISLLLSYSLYAQGKFVRVDTISVPPLETSFGSIVAGLDLDKDGKWEIYAVNNDMNDTEQELIPKLYKFEKSGGKWSMVWQTVLDVPYQNSWPGLTVGDMDKDGLKEIIWSPANWITDTGKVNTNPIRIAVFEARNDGSEGVGYDFFGTSVPNAKWTITSTPKVDMRPFKLIVLDADGDGKNELVYADRQATSGLSFGIVGVNKIPESADNSEVWTMEMNGKDPAITGLSTASKYDIVKLNNVLYLFDSGGKVFPIKFDNGTWKALPSQNNIAGTTGSWKAAKTVDLDKDGKDEIVFGGWSDGKVYLCQQANDTLVATEIGSFVSLGVTRLNGGDSGDLDGDGKLDFVYGTRADKSIPKNAICRLQYKGGPITDPKSYSASLIDSLININATNTQGGQIDEICVADVDGDGKDEVLYSSSYPRPTGLTDDPQIPIAILKYQDPSSVAKETGIVPENFYMEQNYPNPFNPSTTIKFGLSASSNVSLKVFNILGQEVATLVNNQYMTAGVYNVDFNASNLSSGTYVYQLISNNQLISKKMQLMK